MKETGKTFVSLYGIEAGRLPQGSWIALEGTDVVGKTSQLSELVKASCMVLPCAAIMEFSNSPLGKTINEIISQQRFYSLDPQHRTPKADTLALAADLMFNIERDIVPTLRKNGLIFSDRGPASTLAYQSIRLHDWQPEEFETIEKAMEFVYPLIAIMPVRRMN
jgi:thymidylate kinase